MKIPANVKIRKAYNKQGKTSVYKPGMKLLKLKPMPKVQPNHIQTTSIRSTAFAAGFPSNSRAASVPGSDLAPK